MEELRQQLKETFATAFCMYLKAANFHWNVEGADFYQHHKFFGDIVSDVYGSIDPLAEHIRQLQTYAPASLKRFNELTKVEDCLKPLTAPEMISELVTDNATMIDVLSKTLMLSEKHQMHGLTNYLAARIEQHQKWAWFLRSLSKERA